MNKNDIFTYLKDLEKDNEQLKKWGDIFRAEKAIIDKIIQIRKEKNMSQEDLGKLTDLKQSAIARIENRVHSPQLNTIIKIIHALDLEIEIKDHSLQRLSEDMHEFICDEYKNYYSEIHEENKIYTLPKKEGGLTNENQTIKYPGNKNLPA